MDDDDPLRIDIILHPETIAYLGLLAETCLYGDTVDVVAIALIDEGIRNAIKNRFIKSRTEK